MAAKVEQWAIIHNNDFLLHNSDLFSRLLKNNGKVTNNNSCTNLMKINAPVSSLRPCLHGVGDPGLVG